MSSTAPMAKLGATTALAPPASNSRAAVARSASESPVVPTTAWMPRCA